MAATQEDVGQYESGRGMAEWEIENNPLDLTLDRMLEQWECMYRTYGEGELDDKQMRFYAAGAIGVIKEVLG
jgi:hypothetical protein